jgi:hypothetical protein
MLWDSKLFIPPTTKGRQIGFKPEILQLVFEAGLQGASLKGMWAYLQSKGYGVPLATFKHWIDRNSPNFVPELREAVDEGLALAQARFEQIGLEASQGLVEKHAASTYQFLMKNRFRQDYREESFQNVRSSGTLEITPGMDPQLAAQRYKEMVLGSGEVDESKLFE